MPPCKKPSVRSDERKQQIAPRLISQLTCEAATGINARRFLELLPRLGIHVARYGKLRLVSLDAFEGAVMQLNGAGTPVDDEDDVDDEQPTDASAVLAKLGLRRAS